MSTSAKMRLRSFESKARRYFISSTCILCDEQPVFKICVETIQSIRNSKCDREGVDPLANQISRQCHAFQRSLPILMAICSQK